jgi:hypothetical protein
MKIDKKDVPERFDYCFVDCDLISYRSSFSAEKTYWHLYKEDGTYVDRFDSAKKADEYTDELWSIFDIDTSGYYREPEKIIGDVEQAINACDLIIKHIQKSCPSDHYKFYLTGNDTYRGSIATLHKYKGDRDRVAKPKWINEVREHIKKEYGAISVDVWEADDSLSVGMWHTYKKGLKSVAANLDKDVLQSPGFHYDWVKDIFQYVTPEEGLRWLFIQTLAGDFSVDNYEGIPGIGKVKAKKILEGCETERQMYDASVEAYKNYFGEEYTYKSWDGMQMTKTAEEIMLENLRLAYMLRRKDEEYKIPKKE